MSKGRRRGAIKDWANPSLIDAEELRESFSHPDFSCIADAEDRAMVSLRGSVRTVTLRPRGGVPALEVELTDGTGHVALIFLGRRRIAGITPGRDMTAHGRLGLHGRERVIYNPRYELIA